MLANTQDNKRADAFSFAMLYTKPFSFVKRSKVLHYNDYTIQECTGLGWAGYAKKYF